VRDVVTDSRRVKPGALFVCLKGARHDGHAFVPKAVRNGAAAVVAGRPLRSTVPVLEVRDTKLALALASATFWGHASRYMDVVGITGTNGKTTTAYMLESILGSAGVPCALFGTVEYRFGPTTFRHEHTTDFSNDLQRLFATVRDSGAKAVVMEVSSHGLALSRVRGVSFRGGVFTNLTRDHLDFHGDMRRYFQAKGLLFSSLPSAEHGGLAVLNWDDKAGRRMAGLTRARILRYSCAGGGRRGRFGDVGFHNLRADLLGTSFVIEEGGEKTAVRLHLLGGHNAANAVAAAAAARGLGVETAKVKAGLESLENVPGRMEKVALRAPFSVLVDYAHTPDALERLLFAARRLGGRKLLTVFGCGGNRDRGKRPLMGEIATRLSDFSWVTSDNPRDEDPEEIIRGISAGIRRVGSHSVMVDRREAISRVLSAAGAGDVVVIAGKGHEAQQIVRGKTIPFSDKRVAMEEWRRLTRRGSGKR